MTHRTLLCSCMTGLLTCTAALSLCAHSHGTADSKHQATLAATTSDSIPGMEAPFKGHFTNSEHGFNLYIDLYEASLSAPGFSFLGKMHGYLNGRIYGTWLLVSHHIEGNKATLRYSNDQGADSQTVEICMLNDSTLSYKAVGTNNIRRVQGRKLGKTASEFTMVRVTP